MSGTRFLGFLFEFRGRRAQLLSGFIRLGRALEFVRKVLELFAPGHHLNELLGRELGFGVVTVNLTSRGSLPTPPLQVLGASRR